MNNKYLISVLLIAVFTVCAGIGFYYYSAAHNPDDLRTEWIKDHNSGNYDSSPPTLFTEYFNKSAIFFIIGINALFLAGFLAVYNRRDQPSFLLVVVFLTIIVGILTPSLYYADNFNGQQKALVETGKINPNQQPEVANLTSKLQLQESWFNILSITSFLWMISLIGLVFWIRYNNDPAGIEDE